MTSPFLTAHWPLRALFCAWLTPPVVAVVAIRSWPSFSESVLIFPAVQELLCSPLLVWSGSAYPGCAFHAYDYAYVLLFLHIFPYAHLPLNELLPHFVALWIDFPLAHLVPLDGYVRQFKFAIMEVDVWGKVVVLALSSQLLFHDLDLILDVKKSFGQLGPLLVEFHTLLHVVRCKPLVFLLQVYKLESDVFALLVKIL